MSRRSMLSIENRKLGKHKYQPLVSFVGERPDAQEQPPLTPVEEEAQSQDDASVTNKRDRFIPPRDPEVRAALARLVSYLERSGVEKTFLTLNKRLMSLTDLPYNPYPGFVRRVREGTERFYMFEETKQAILKKMANPTKPTRISSIVTLADREGVWGLAGPVGATHPDVGSRYRWLLATLTPPKETLALDEDQDYSNQVMPALMGSCAFHHSFYLQPQEVAVRVEYLVAGTQQKKAIELFAESVAKDVLHMDSNTSHIILGTVLPTGDNSGTTKTWTAESVSEQKEQFVNVVIEEAKKREKICVEGIFRMEEHSDVYIWGKKQYVLNFLKVKEGSGEEEGVTAFTELPLMTLHEGLFLNILHVDSYMASFAKLMEDDSGSKARSRRPSKQPSSHVQTDGFRLGSKIHLDPFTPKIIKPIKEELQRRVVALHPQARIFDAIPSLILLCFIDKLTFGEDLLVELYRMLRSTAWRLHRLQKVNSALRAAISKLKNTGHNEVVMGMFTQYRRGISDLFSDTLQERSHDLVEAGKVLVGRLDRLVQPGTDTIPLSSKTLLELRHLSGYCIPLQLQLTEDALSHCPKLKETLVSLAKAFPDDVPRPKTPTRQRKQERQQQQQTKSNKKKEPLRVGQGVDNFIHGIEDENISKHDKQAINVKKNKQKESAPQSVAMDSVLIRFMVDTRLDEVWPEYLIDLLSDHTLPPNPYPRLCSALRKATVSQDLCQENPDKLIKRLLHGAARLEDNASHVYHLPGADAHGCKSALAVVDSSVFFKLASMCQPFILQDFIQRKGPYRVAMCCGLGGHTPLFGRLMPYLLHIHLEEHCYIRGPDGGAQDSMKIYAKIVYEHLLSLHKKKEHPLSGLYLGGGAPLLISETNKRDVIQQLERAWSERHQVYAKIYTMMDWRYVPVKKYYKFHYINVEETDFQGYFPNDASSFYQQVFFEGEKASFHYQYGGPDQTEDPYSVANVRAACKVLNHRIVQARDHHDWLGLHRWLLTRNLITQGSSHIVETWRMLHGAGGQFEYLVSLVAALIDLVWYARTEPAGEDNTKTKVGALDLKALGRMTQAFRHKAEQVCQTRAAMAAPSLAEVLRVKVQQVTERLEDTKELYLTLTAKTVDTLEEVMGMLEMLRDITSYDVHLICPEAQTMLRAVQGEVDRPSSGVTQPSTTTVNLH